MRSLIYHFTFSTFSFESFFLLPLCTHIHSLSLASSLVELGQQGWHRLHDHPLQRMTLHNLVNRYPDSYEHGAACDVCESVISGDDAHVFHCTDTKCGQFDMCISCASSTIIHVTRKDPCGDKATEIEQTAHQKLLGIIQNRLRHRKVCTLNEGFDGGEHRLQHDVFNCSPLCIIIEAADRSGLTLEEVGAIVDKSGGVGGVSIATIRRHVNEDPERTEPGLSATDWLSSDETLNAAHALIDRSGDKDEGMSFLGVFDGNLNGTMFAERLQQAVPDLDANATGTSISYIQNITPAVAARSGVPSTHANPRASRRGNGSHFVHMRVVVAHPIQGSSGAPR